MKTIPVSLLVMLATGFSASAANKAYQVTGPVVETTDSTITVDKGGEKWTLQKDPTTKVNGDVKVGAKVTVKYTMTATDIEMKESKETKNKKK